MGRAKIFRYIKVLVKKQVILIIVILSVASNTYVLYINNEYNKFWNSVDDKIDATFLIISEPMESEYNYKYIVKGVDNKYKNKKFLLYAKKNKESLLEYGDLIKLKGDFSIPDTRRNYKGFDYKEYLKTKKIYGIIHTNNQNISVVKKDQNSVIYTIPNNMRKGIIEKGKLILPERTRGLLIGILLGDITDISDETIENFKSSSLIHLLAVSGGHIHYIILGTTYLLNKGKLSKRKENIISIIILILFMAITGFSSSVVRACIMGIILLGSKIVYRKQEVWTSIAFSLLLIMIENPFSINDIGLQLSYIGTIGIVLFNRNIQDIILKTKINKKLGAGLSITFSAQVLLIPIMVYTFNTLSLTFFISNIIAMPLTGVITSLGFVNIFLSFVNINIAKLIAVVLNLFLEMLLLVSDITAKIPFSSIITKTPHLITIILLYIVILIFNSIYSIYIKDRERKAKRKIDKEIMKHIRSINKKKSIIVIILLIFLFSFCNYIYINIETDLRIFFIDLGQGERNSAHHSNE